MNRIFAFNSCEFEGNVIARNGWKIATVNAENWNPYLDRLQKNEQVAEYKYTFMICLCYGD